MVEGQQLTKGAVISVLIIIFSFFLGWFADAPFLSAIFGVIIGVSVGVVIDRSGAEEEAEAERQVRLKKMRSECVQEAFEIVGAEVNKHLSTLLRKRRMLVRQGDYGQTIVDDWHRELIVFFRSDDSQKCISSSRPYCFKRHACISRLC